MEEEAAAEHKQEQPEAKASEAQAQEEPPAKGKDEPAEETRNEAMQETKFKPVADTPQPKKPTYESGEEPLKEGEPVYSQVRLRKSFLFWNSPRGILIGLAGLLFGVFIIAEGIDLLNRHYDNSASIQAPAYAKDSAQHLHKTQASTESNKEKAVKPPHWLQGNWSVATPTGSISLRIKGQQIDVSDGHHISVGHFVYRRHRLYCRFDDGRRFVYNVDTFRQEIVVGQGLRMKKHP